MARVCPYCRQVIAVERYGVPLTPLKAGIFDAIRAAGDAGITSTEIIGGQLYCDRRRVSRDTIKAHVWQINALLEQTNWVIKSETEIGAPDMHLSERRWHLRRRRVRRVA